MSGSPPRTRIRASSNVSTEVTSCWGVSVETNKATGETTVDAPFAHVEKDQNGTRVQAPGVNIDVPKKPADR